MLTLWLFFSLWALCNVTLATSKFLRSASFEKNYRVYSSITLTHVCMCSECIMHSCIMRTLNLLIENWYRFLLITCL